MGTRVCQCKPEDIEAKGKQLHAPHLSLHIWPSLQWAFHSQHGSNASLFSMITKKTLELVGKKTIHIRMLSNNTRRVTMAVTIAGDSTLLPSMIIFKG
jgi:hypothetical protein